MLKLIKYAVLRIALRILRDDVEHIEECLCSLPLVKSSFQEERENKLKRIAALECELALAKARGVVA